MYDSVCAFTGKAICIPAKTQQAITILLFVIIYNFFPKKFKSCEPFKDSYYTTTLKPIKDKLNLGIVKS
jgi:hypothetical protein